VLEAKISFPGEQLKAVRVFGPDGKEVPAQISEGKVIFLANAPSVGYAVYDVRPGAGAAESKSQLQVAERSLENEFYRVQLNDDGDVASIFDKKINKELLAATARLAL
jgi:alpha-mannosidase